MTVEALLREIRQAFIELPRPKRTMADAEVEDDQSEASRFPERDTHWWEVPDDLLRRCSAPMCFLAPADFVYYLPAYMSWFLRTGGGAHSFSSESLIYYLSDVERGGAIAGLLEGRQRRAVVSFLEFVTSSPSLWWFHRDARSGLLAIWKAPSAAPNGGPATRPGNSEITEVAPSVNWAFGGIMTPTKIDEAVLAVAEERWQKVAMMIIRAAEKLGGDLPEGEVGHQLVGQRIAALVEDGRLVSAGDISRWRYSEVRLPS